MAFHSSTLVNNGQSSNDADGVITGTIPGSAGDVVLVACVINNGTGTISIGDNGNGGSANTGANPWTRGNSPNPDVVNTNTDAAWFAKVLQAGDVGKTFTLTVSNGGGIRFPAAAVSFSGRSSSIADLIIQRASASGTINSTTFTPDGVTSPADGYDVCGLFFARDASATQINMTSAGGSQVVSAQAATAFGASPNYAVTITTRDNAPAGAHGGNAVTWNTTITQAIGYMVGLKSAAPTNSPPTCNAGADQTSVEPYTVVTLSGTDSDSDGTIASRAWSGDGFTFLTGQSTATATAKVRGSIAGETLVATYTVTDNQGATGSDTVNVTTLPVTERIFIGGTWHPLEVRTL